MSSKTLATEQGREHALKALHERREKNKGETKIDNRKLPAGSPMYFYCIGCGDVADELPESFTRVPKRLCDECKALKDLGWLE